MTARASPNAITVASTAPVTTASMLLAMTAQILLHSGVEWWSSAGTSSICTPPDRLGERRARLAAVEALAGLRHPAAISATIARPAIQAEAVVSSVIDTQDEMLMTTPIDVRAPRALHRAWAIPMVVVAFAAITAMLLASMLPANLRAENPSGVDAGYALVPANAEAVAPRLSFDAVERYDADGELLFVTVREPEITLLDWIIGKDEPEVRLLSSEEKFGVQTPEQQRQFNVQLMRTAKETAEYVALDHLGYPVEIVPGEVIVGSVVCLEASDDGSACVDYAPSDDLLDPGDQLRTVAGEEVELLDELAPILSKYVPGDRIPIEFVRPGGGPRSGEVELIASPDDPTRTIIGFLPFDTASATVPFEITIDSGAIGGPSAGLAFALTLIDELTPGELTGGARVAVTGTIQIDGTVGAIGGLAQKTSAVKQLGAKVFIVPSAQGDDDLARARDVAGGDVRIIPVDDLEGALAALADLGGNGSELGKPGLDFEAS